MVAAFHDVCVIFQSRRKKAGIHFRIHVVVRIRKTDIKAAGGIQPCIPCCGDACVPLVQKDDSAVLFFPAQQMCLGLIRGAVIDADNFNVPESLAYQTLQAAVHVCGYIVAGNNDGNIGDHRGGNVCNGFTIRGQ